MRLQEDCAIVRIQDSNGIDSKSCDGDSDRVTEFSFKVVIQVEPNDVIANSQVYCGDFAEIDIVSQKDRIIWIVEAEQIHRANSISAVNREDAGLASGKA